MAIDAGGALGFHLLVRGLCGCARWLGVLMAILAGDAVPVFQGHASIVGHDWPALVKFLNRRVVIFHLREQRSRAVIYMRPQGQMEVS